MLSSTTPTTLTLTQAYSKLHDTITREAVILIVFIGLCSFMLFVGLAYESYNRWGRGRDGSDG